MAGLFTKDDCTFAVRGSLYGCGSPESHLFIKTRRLQGNRGIPRDLGQSFYVIPILSIHLRSRRQKVCYNFGDGGRMVSARFDFAGLSWQLQRASTQRASRLRL